MYDPYIGPRHIPNVVEQFHSQRNQSLLLFEYRSSMLPASTIDGTEDAKPEKNRPTKTPTGEGTTPTSKDEMLYKAADNK
jgi:hypothetical protein